MSDHHAAPQPFYERYWQIGVILFAILLVSIFASFAPVAVGTEDGATSAPQHHAQ